MGSVLLQDVADGDVTAHLATAPLDSPSVVAFTDGGRIHATFVVGDGVDCELVGQNQNICGSLVVLLCLYYLFDLAYPRPYAMLMALLLHFVAEEPYKSETSRGFKTFVKHLDTVFQETPTVAAVEFAADDQQ